MNEWIITRINSLKEDLSKKQEYFKINIQNMDSPTYEDNTITGNEKTENWNRATWINVTDEWYFHREKYMKDVKR